MEVDRIIDIILIELFDDSNKFYYDIWWSEDYYKAFLEARPTIKAYNISKDVFCSAIRLMQKEGIIELFQDDIYELTKSGFRIKQHGGWVNHLTLEKEKEAIAASDRELSRDVSRSVKKNAKHQTNILIATTLIALLSFGVSVLTYLKQGKADEKLLQTPQNTQRNQKPSKELQDSALIFRESPCSH